MTNAPRTRGAVDVKSHEHEPSHWNSKHMPHRTQDQDALGVSSPPRPPGHLRLLLVSGKALDLPVTDIKTISPASNDPKQSWVHMTDGAHYLVHGSGADTSDARVQAWNEVHGRQP
jgi:hypothetical protein